MTSVSGCADLAGPVVCPAIADRDHRLHVACAPASGFVESSASNILVLQRVRRNPQKRPRSPRERQSSASALVTAVVSGAAGSNRPHRSRVPELRRDDPEHPGFVMHCEDINVGIDLEPLTDPLFARRFPKLTFGVDNHGHQLAPVGALAQQYPHRLATSA